MKNKKLDLLVEEIQRQYDKSHEEYLMSSMLSIHGIETAYACKRFLNKINEVYNTNYELKNQDQ
jgi:hypothetical protein